MRSSIKVSDISLVFDLDFLYLIYLKPSTTKLILIEKFVNIIAMNYKKKHISFVYEILIYLNL